QHQLYYKELMRLGYHSVELPGVARTATRQPTFQAITQNNPALKARVRDLVRLAATAARRVPAGADLAEANREMTRVWKEIVTAGRSELRSKDETKTVPSKQEKILEWIHDLKGERAKN